MAVEADVGDMAVGDEAEAEDRASLGTAAAVATITAVDTIHLMAEEATEEVPVAATAVKAVVVVRGDTARVRLHRAMVADTATLLRRRYRRTAGAAMVLLRAAMAVAAATVVDHRPTGAETRMAPLAEVRGRTEDQVVTEVEAETLTPPLDRPPRGTHTLLRRLLRTPTAVAAHPLQTATEVMEAAALAAARATRTAAATAQHMAVTRTEASPRAAATAVAEADHMLDSSGQFCMYCSIAMYTLVTACMHRLRSMHH